MFFLGQYIIAHVDAPCKFAPVDSYVKFRLYILKHWSLLQVSAFSTWEKELPKFVFDSRYLLLNQRERKTAFDQYVRTRAEEERIERRNKLKEKKEAFKALLEEAKVSSRYCVSILHTIDIHNCTKMKMEYFWYPFACFPVAKMVLSLIFLIANCVRKIGVPAATA